MGPAPEWGIRTERAGEMRVRRSAAAGLAGLVLVIGASGCGKITEKVAEEAVERNSDCKNVDIDSSGGGFSGTCGGTDLSGNLSGEGDLPDGFPAELAPPEGFAITASQGDPGPPQTFNVVGSLDGDVATVYEGIKAQLTEAGYTIDAEDLSDVGGGQTGTLAASGPDFVAGVTVSEVQNALEGNVTVTYTLTAP